MEYNITSQLNIDAIVNKEGRNIKNIKIRRTKKFIYGSTWKNTLAVTSVFSSATAAVGNISNHDDSYNRGTGIRDASASQFETFMFQASSGSLSDDDTDHSVAIHGDLA